ncbi:MAG: NADH-quinone oxidoreductase subunit M [Chloroflexi bacterium]|nr:NADH-quinone oxidoreductase subunit M [Chloroflexota bacterium]
MDFPFLTFIIGIPLLGLILIILSEDDQKDRIRTIAGITSFITMLFCIFMFCLYNYDQGGYQFVEWISWFPAIGVEYHLGVDGFNAPLVLLTGILGFACTMVSFNIKERVREYFALTFAVLAGVFGVFASMNLFFFIVFYELSSIPMYFLIGIWGSDKMGEGKEVNKKYAATKLILYLQLGGGLILLGALGLYFLSGANTFNMWILQKFPIAAKWQMIVFPIIFIGFAIEAGMVPFHTWLPDGHSAAPTALSMILAGVLLKMGGYGIIRVAVGLMPDGADFWLKIFAVFAIINILYGALCAMMQTDIKYIIAYSSVSHMGLVILGIAAMTPLALQGASFQMFSHGIITALLFALAGYLYEKTHTRALKDYGGLGVKIPMLAAIFVFAGLASLGLPGLSGFVAELMVFLGAYKIFPVIVILGIFGILLTAIYILRAVQKIFFGPLNEKCFVSGDLTGVEKAGPVVLAFVIALFGFFPSILTKVTNPAVLDLISRFGGM